MIVENSEREAQVLELSKKGHTVGTIARMLKISSKTVSTYRARAAEKLGCKNMSDFNVHVRLLSDPLRIALRKGSIGEEEFSKFLLVVAFPTVEECAAAREQLLSLTQEAK